jgi:hypothetical protein
MSLMCHWAVAYKVTFVFVWSVPKKCLIFGPTLYAFCLFCSMMGSTGVQSYNSSMDWCSFSFLPNRKFGLQIKLITWMWWYEKTYNLVFCLCEVYEFVFRSLILCHIWLCSHTCFHENISLLSISVYSSVHGW